MTDRGNVETRTPSLSQTVHEVLGQPFEALTLHRPMKLFPTTLGLTPLTPSEPTDDFLANLVSGRRTHLAIVREIFGKDFKNFVNFSRGKVETTPEVYMRLIQALQGDEKLLEVMAGFMKLGTLSIQFANLFRLIENILNHVISAASSGAGMCPTCRQQRISQAAIWWSEQQCTLEGAEYRFVDRLLNNVLAVALMPRAFKPDWSVKEDPTVPLVGLCAKGTHPFKHWLNLVREAYRAKDLTSLATCARMNGPSPDSHLQRCSRGEMLTVNTIFELTAKLPQPKPLRDLGMQARALAFAIDFLVAADEKEDPISWHDAQEIVQARTIRLRKDLRNSLETSHGLPPVLVHALT